MSRVPAPSPSSQRSRSVVRRVFLPAYSARARSRPSSSPPRADAGPSKGEKTPARLGLGREDGLAEPPPRRPFLARLPGPLALMLGHRNKEQTAAPASLIKPLNRIPLSVETYIFSFLSSFLSICFILLLFSKTSILQEQAPASKVLIVGSFGASAVLCSGLPASPLSQPRNVIGGQVLSALVGCIIAVIFEHFPGGRYRLEDAYEEGSVVWVAGGLGMALSLVVMMATGTVHPPGGATAVLAVTSSAVVRVGFLLVPMVLISSIIMVATHMLALNLTRRRYPHYYWSPLPPPSSSSFVPSASRPSVEAVDSPSPSLASPPLTDDKKNSSYIHNEHLSSSSGPLRTLSRNSARSETSGQGKTDRNNRVSVVGSTLAETTDESWVDLDEEDRTAPVAERDRGRASKR